MRFANRIKQETTSTGTGNLALTTAPVGYEALTSAFGSGQKFIYVIEDQVSGQWELGHGYMSGSNLVREYPLEGSATLPIAFGAGTKYVFGSHPANLSAGMHAAIFGDGSDGDRIASSGTITLSQPLYAQHIILTGSARIVTNGHKIRVSGVLDLSNTTSVPAITADGANGTNGAASGAGGVSPAAASSVTAGTGARGGDGGAGGTAAGSVGSAGGNLTSGHGGGGGDSNAAGAGSGGAGGAGASGGSCVGYTRFGVEPLMVLNAGTLVLARGGAGGAGGAGGGGDGTAGGGGGSGGAGGSVVDLRAAIVKLGPSTIFGAITAHGGNGGDGGAPAAGNRGGGSGGGGGGGGFVHIVYGNKIGSATNWVSAAGAVGGDGRPGSGIAGSGLGGNGGNGGTIRIIDLDAGVTTEYTGSAGSAGSGINGGAGGSCLGGT